MAQRGDEFFNPVTKTRVVFLSVPADTGGRELAVDWFVPPGETLPAAAHYHLGTDGGIAERFEIIAGTASCKVGDKTITVSAPATIDIAFNQIHTHPANIGAQELHVRQIGQRDTADPALDRVVGFFETLLALSQQGKANRKGDITNPLQAALTINDMLLDPTFLPGLPRGFQKAAFGSLARLARWRGYQAYHQPQTSA